MDELEEYSLCTQHILKEVRLKGQNLRKPSDGSSCSIVIHVMSGETPGEQKFTTPTAITITLGDANEVFDKVLEYCVTTMSVGEESTFKVPAITYNLKFQLTLKDCTFKNYLFQMADDEKYEMAKAYKQQGVELFKQQKYVHAFLKFKKSLQYVLSMQVFYPSEKPHWTAEYGSYDFEADEVVSHRVTLYNNLASCQLQCKSYPLVMPLCTKSLTIQPSVKAYYRRALAFIELAEYESAENDLKNLLKIEGNNKAALEKLMFVRNLDKDNREYYKATIKKMFA